MSITPNRHARPRLHQGFRAVTIALDDLLAILDADDGVVAAIAHSLDEVFEEYLGVGLDDSDSLSDDAIGLHPAMTNVITRLDRYLHPMAATPIH